MLAIHQLVECGHHIRVFFNFMALGSTALPKFDAIAAAAETSSFSSVSLGSKNIRTFKRLFA